MTQPKGVKIIYGDGEELNCELEHVGEEIKDGSVVDMWEIANATRGFSADNGDKIFIEELPALTGIRFPVDELKT